MGGICAEPSSANERSDLKVVFARTLDRFGIALGCSLKFLQLLKHVIEVLTEFVRLDFDAGFATLTDDVTLCMFFEITNRHRVYVSAFRTDNIDSLIFKHTVPLNSHSDQLTKPDFCLYRRGAQSHTGISIVRP
jgi:hypothetical protein